MVMSTESQEQNDNIQFIDPVGEGGDTAVAEAPVDETTTVEAPPETPDADTEVEAEEELSIEPETPANAEFQQASFLPSVDTTPKVDQTSIDELNQRRAADQQREWQETVGRRARAFEQQLQDNGYMPEQAREQARRYIQQEQKFKQQEKESQDMVGFLQGRQAAAVHFMKQHKLADQQMLDDFIALQNANTPAEMEREAKRMRRERALIAENARLKQGRVAPQTFDNSQGSAEVTTNQDRLLDAYINGDRSEAAVQAAKRLLI